MASIAELLARWDSDEGRPYKGSLIDFAAYEANPDNIGCMCAQGQVLHVVGGRSAEWLRAADQMEADRETAALLNISRAHAILLRQVNDGADGAPSIVLTDPSVVLGDQWSKLLDFWWFIDQMDDAAWAAAGDAAGAAAGEIQGAGIFRQANRSFYFLPMFGFQTPDNIPARPADYGVSA